MVFPEKRADALIALVERRLPLEVTASTDREAWPLVGPALLAHAAGTVRAMFVLGHAEAWNDAYRLLRCLYEHVLVFAWLGTEPSAERLGTWRKHDLDLRIKADTELQAVGRPLLEEVARENMQADVESLPGQLLDAKAMAFSVDKHWAPTIDFLDRGGARSFVGLYTIVFRQYSALVHPTYRGTNQVVEDLGPHHHRVIMQVPGEGRGPLGMAVSLLFIALAIAARTLGWPTHRELNAAFAAGGDDDQS